MIMITLAPFVVSLAIAAQIPDPARNIAVARDAKAKSEAASQGANQPKQPPAAPAPTPGASGAPGTPGAAGAPPTQQTPGNPAAGPEGPASAAGFTYDPAGRRDPFVSLIGRGTELPTSGAARPQGVPGLLISEVALKGVWKSAKGDFLAVLQTSDGRTFIARAGDKVFDGSIKTITQEAVVFAQDVNDPLSLVKQREVRKTIRPEAR